MAKRMKWWDWLMIILVLVGGINWGLVGLFKFNLVEWLLGSVSFLERTVYVLVGASAGYSAFKLFK